jgi:hypothetical protein
MPDMPAPKPTLARNEAFLRFEQLARRIVSIPKKEIDARRAEQDKAKQPPKP